MKTNTSRVRSNAIPKNSKPQAKREVVKATPSQAQIAWRKRRAARRKAYGPEFRLPKDAKQVNCLATFDRDSAQLCSHVPLSEDEFSALWNFCLRNTPIKRDVSFRPVVMLADIIRKGLAVSANDCGWSGLELNVTKVQGLLQLLSDKLDHIRTDGSEFSGRDVETLCAGVNEIVRDARKSLRAAFDKTFHAVHGPAQTPAISN